MKKLQTILVLALAVLMAGCNASKEPNAELVAWGLGKYESAHVSLDRPYEWYIDQAELDEEGSDFGLACAMMAGKWYDEDFKGTLVEIKTYCEQVKEQKHANYEGWTYSIMLSALEHAEVPCSLERLPSSLYKKNKVITEELKDGNIVIVAIRPRLITFATDPDFHAGIFYGGDKNFIIIKGYRIVDNKTYFEVYDPNSQTITYDNGELVGKDRYYLRDQVVASVEDYVDNYIVIEAPEA